MKVISEHVENEGPGSTTAGILDVVAAQPFRVDRILVPVDFSSCSSKALVYALNMAAKFDSTLILLHVLEPHRGGSRYSQASQHVLESAKEKLSELTRLKSAPGTRFETLVRVGLAHSEISDTAKALACDLIIMGTRGCGSQPSTLGSNADWVVHHAPCPVLTLGPC